MMSQQTNMVSIASMNEIKIKGMDIVVCTWFQKAWEEQAP
jgi:hypothetical protein